MKIVLEKLRDTIFFLKSEKCEFYVDTTSFLGLKISPSGIWMGSRKGKICTRIEAAINCLSETVIPVIFKLLSPLHQELFICFETIG